MAHFEAVAVRRPLRQLPANQANAPPPDLKKIAEKIVRKTKAGLAAPAQPQAAAVPVADRRPLCQLHAAPANAAARPPAPQQLAKKVVGAAPAAVAQPRAAAAFNAAAHTPRPLNPERVKWLTLNQHADNVSRIYKVSKKVIETAAEHVFRHPNPVGWHPVVVPEIFQARDGRQTTVFHRFLVYQSAAPGEMPELYLRAKALGHGSYSTVEEVVCLNSSHRYALKLSLDPAQEDPRYVMGMVTFLNKDHTHVGIVGKPLKYCEFQEGGCTRMGYLEELCEGDLDHKPPETNALFKKCVCELTDGLLYFQKIRGIHHGDIKPGNILRKNNGFMLSDWGLSIRYEELRTHFHSSREQYRRDLNMIERRFPDRRNPQIQQMFWQAAEKAAMTQVASLTSGTPGYFSAADFELLRKAIMMKDENQAWNEFKKIQESRDIFALGASIIKLLDPAHFYLSPPKFITILDIPKQLKPHEIDQIKANGYSEEQIRILSDKLTFSQIKNLHLIGFTPDQVVMIGRMVGKSAQRPTADEIYLAFHPEEFRRAAAPLGAPAAAAAATQPAIVMAAQPAAAAAAVSVMAHPIAQERAALLSPIPPNQPNYRELNMRRFQANERAIPLEFAICKDQAPGPGAAGAAGFIPQSHVPIHQPAAARLADFQPVEVIYGDLPAIPEEAAAVSGSPGQPPLPAQPAQEMIIVSPNPQLISPPPKAAHAASPPDPKPTLPPNSQDSPAEAAAPSSPVQSPVFLTAKSLHQPVEAPLPAAGAVAAMAASPASPEKIQELKVKRKELRIQKSRLESEISLNTKLDGFAPNDLVQQRNLLQMQIEDLGRQVAQLEPKADSDK